MAKKEKPQKPSNLEKLIQKEGITEKEFKDILKSRKADLGKKENLYLTGRKIRYGYFSDAHIGHKSFREDLWDLMTKTFRRDNVDFIVDVGDHLEGMSGRPGHVYELTHIGFNQQINYAADLFNQLPAPTYGIDGNHDQWFFTKNNAGIIVGKELENRVKKYNHLGQDEADIMLNPKTKLKLFHANDGSAYAISYKLQKLIESFTGGDKPNIVHSGHYHKALYMFNRNVHGFESGTLCGQSKWMRGKKIPAHMGFGIVDVYLDKNGVNHLEHKFIPAYEKK
ncbi:metallophosphoesterase [Oceanihabitans sediminis]|uniref:metallophosphoesterase n=1 Tax=Oceanihabitans sediminis TaxID=1812012 RepID=UPI00299DA919|nr:metallophosphoesterase [Oceanihabitans sediminis]MDX1279024.1 metallophosphoesterase [Oceanihabitans sediminis]